ncbi:unnamed protein product, partial [Mycena citricolor]
AISDRNSACDLTRLTCFLHPVQLILSSNRDTRVLRLSITMNLGLGDYGSDSEDGGSDAETPVVAAKAAPIKVTKVQRAPKKIAIALPVLEAAGEEQEGAEERPTKRRRVEGVGKSTLLSMLPAPKQKMRPMTLPGSQLPSRRLSSDLYP